MRLYAILVLSYFLGVNAADAQPFGLHMGMGLDQLSVQKEINKYEYAVSPPKSQPQFEEFIVKLTPRQGLCLIKAVGVDHNNDADGRVIRDVVATIRAQVAEIYGASSLYDHVDQKSTLDESKDWSTSLRKHERDYQVSWDKVSGSSMSNNVKEILLTTVSLEPGRNYVTLQYKFYNHDACQSEIDAAPAKVH